MALTALVGANQRLPGAQRLVDVVGRRSGDYLQAVSGIINVLEVWDHPGLDAVTRRAGLDLDQFLDSPSLLIVAAPIHGGRISEASSSLLLSQLIHRLYRRFTSKAGRHVFLMVDEAARLVNRLRFEELLSVGRRARVSVVLATQDVGQFTNADERSAILGNCATYISLPSRSKMNADHLASRLGERYQSSLSLSDGGAQSAPGRWTRSSQIDSTPILGHREILDPPWGERTAVVHCQPVARKPFLVDLFRPEFA
jgi:type IV secretory pathway TraG/TraD family ATPase VirD4